MSSYPRSLVSIAPAAYREALLAAGAAYGVDGGLAVRLSADGQEPATHYGSHAWVQTSFADVVTEKMPVAPEGYTEQQISRLLRACTFSVDPVVDGEVLTKRKHFNKVLADEGLQVITAEI